MNAFTPARRALLPLLARIAPAARGPFVPFVLLSTQRSGSSWLLDRLHTQPGVFVHSELFLNEGEGLPRYLGDGELPFFNTYAERAGAGAGWMAQRAQLSRYLDDALAPRPGVSAAGFKLMYSQVERRPQLLAPLVWRRVRVLHLLRENLLDVFLSRLTRNERGYAHAHVDDPAAAAHTGEPTEAAASRVDCDALLRFLEESTRKREIWRDQLRRIGLRHHEVTYEDLVEDEAVLDRCLAFLDQPPADRSTVSAFRKLARGSRRERIVNAEAVERALAATPWARLLDA